VLIPLFVVLVNPEPEVQSINLDNTPHAHWIDKSHLIPQLLLVKEMMETLISEVDPQSKKLRKTMDLSPLERIQELSKSGLVQLWNF